MDGKKREIKMLQITRDTLATMDDEIATKIQEIVFSHDDDDINEFISSMGSISARPAPPVLDVSNITSSAATIRFHSEHEKNTVNYYVYFRRETGDDDDEKEIEWNSVNLDQGVEEYKLNGLEQETRYQLYGRYKLSLMKHKVWSESSEIVSMITTKMEDIKFEWDPQLKGDGISLSNDNSTLQKTRNSWVSVVSKTMLSSDTM